MTGTPRDDAGRDPGAANAGRDPDPAADPGVEHVLAVVRDRLARSARLGYLALLVGTLAAAAALAALWITEPAPLPGRTRAAFGVILTLLLTWASVAAWTLAAGERSLYGRDRVVATAVGALASAVTSVGCLALATSRAGWAPASAATAVVGMVVTACAVAAHRRARRRHRAMLARRDALARRLSAGQGGA